MTVPKYEEAIDTVADLAKSGVPWGAAEDTWIISIKEAQEVKILSINVKTTHVFYSQTM